MYNNIITELKQTELQAATDYENKFYYKASKEKLFVINIVNKSSCIQVVYGWAFNNNMPGAKEILIRFGVYTTDCNLRYSVNVCDINDWNKAKVLIKSKYIEYSETSKEDMLMVIKNLRNNFMQNITNKLKPLGFKKKSNKWIYSNTLIFNAQKSAYSDQYYFNIYIDDIEHIPIASSFYTRMIVNDIDIVDWQLINPDSFCTHLDEAVNNIIKPIIKRLS